MTECAKQTPKLFFTPWRIGLIGVFALSVILYLQSLMGAPIWDDAVLLKPEGTADQSIVSALNHPFLFNYFRPLTSLSFVFDNTFAKGLPFFFHQTNILIHAFTAVVVCLLAFRLSGSRRAGILSGTFFAVQPLQVGAVAWIGGRTDALSTLFLSLFLLALVRYHQAGGWRWIALSCVAYLLAAFTKEQCAAILPIVPISVLALGTRNWKDAWRLTLPFLVAGIAFGVCFVIGRPPGMPTSGIGFGQNMEMFLRTVWHYSLAVVLPNRGFMVTYSLQNYQRWIWVLAGGIALAGWAFLAHVAWRTNRSQSLMILAAILVSFPVLNFILIPSLWVGPYRIATAGPAIAVCLGCLLSVCLEARRYVVGALLSVNLILGGVVSLWGVHIWQDSMTYFTAVVDHDPAFILGRFNRTEDLVRTDKFRLALAQSDDNLTRVFGSPDWAKQLSTKRAPTMTPMMRRRIIEGADCKPELHLVATLLFQRSRIDDSLHHRDLALSEIWEALRCDPRDPEINFDLGRHLQDSDPKLAQRLMKYAHDRMPDSRDYAIGLAQLDIGQRDYAQAEQLLRAVLSKDDWQGFPWILLSEVLMYRGDLVGARQAIDTAKIKVNLSKVELNAQDAALSRLERLAERRRVRKGGDSEVSQAQSKK